MAAEKNETRYMTLHGITTAAAAGRRLVGCLLVVFAMLLCGCASGGEQSLEITTGQDSPETGKGKEDGNEENDATPGAVEDVAGQVTVYVCGAVCNPGVYTLEGAVRMTQAVEAAGGMLDTADADALNLAQFVSDGQMIKIPYEGELEQTQEDTPVNGEQTDGKININQADAARLQEIPGVGQAKADAIIRYREENGSFESIEDIMHIDGIKEASFNKMKDYICVN